MAADEPDVPERAEPVPGSVAPSSRARPNLATRALPWAILVLVLVTPALGWSDSAQTVQPPDRVAVFVAVPAGQRSDPAMLRAVEHEAGLAVAWLQKETGMTLRGDVSEGRFVWLNASGEDLAGSTVEAVQTIMREVLDDADDPRVFPLVVTPAGTATPHSGPQTCARGWARGLVVLLGNCPSRTPSATALWGSALSRTIAHELVHGMGAVQDCAPNATSSGHVHDEVTDLMYEGPDLQLGGPIVLDAGNDDYWGHDNVGCSDIADSPLWVTPHDPGVLAVSGGR